MIFRQDISWLILCFVEEITELACKFDPARCEALMVAPGPVLDEQIAMYCRLNATRSLGFSSGHSSAWRDFMSLGFEISSSKKWLPRRGNREQSHILRPHAPASKNTVWASEFLVLFFLRSHFSGFQIRILFAKPRQIHTFFYVSPVDSFFFYDPTSVKFSFVFYESATNSYFFNDPTSAKIQFVFLKRNTARFVFFFYKKQPESYFFAAQIRIFFLQNPARFVFFYKSATNSYFLYDPTSAKNQFVLLKRNTARFANFKRPNFVPRGSNSVLGTAFLQRARQPCRL